MKISVTLLSLISTIGLRFYHQASAQSFSICPQRRNITIIPYSIFDDYQEDTYIYVTGKGHMYYYGMQLIHLVKVLIEEMSCFEIWVYSPIQKICIHLTDGNYVQFFESEWTLITSTNDDDISDLVSKIPNTNDDYEQTLLFITYQFNNIALKAHQSTFFSNKLQGVRDKYNIILVCARVIALCTQMEPLLPKQNIIHIDNTYFFNPHLHRILFDSILNPQYNWRDRYMINGSVQCQHLKRKSANIFVWSIYEFLDDDQNYFSVARFLYDYFGINPTIFYGDYMIIESHNATLCYMKSIENWLKSPSRDKDRLLGRLFCEYITEDMKRIGGDIQIHVVIIPRKMKKDFNGPPLTFNNTITITVDDSIEESPMYSQDNRHFVIWREDYTSPLFLSKLLQKINSILCN